ncbi:MAG: hypothetical protein ABII22_04545 [Candidatus Micrarchaeota archaeon]
MANQPEKKLRCGGVTAIVWKNTGTFKGKESEYYTVNFERNYKDKDGKWQSTHGMRAQDLPDIELLARKIYESLRFSEVNGKGSNGSSNSNSSAAGSYDGIEEEELL